MSGSGGPAQQPVDPRWVARLEEGCALLGVGVPRSALERMAAHLRWVLEANRVLNLTAVTDPDVALERHVLDSLAGLRALPSARPLRVVDIGTGAGFPGVPLALADPDGLSLTLVDAAQRKVRALRTALAEVGIDNAEAVQARAEELGRSAARASFDVAVARALAALPVVAEYALPLLRVGGRLIAYRGPEGAAEAAAAARAVATLGGSAAAVHELALPFSGARRTLVVVVKREPTPEQFPRRPGVPERRPLS